MGVWSNGVAQKGSNADARKHSVFDLDLRLCTTDNPNGLVDSCPLEKWLVKISNIADMMITKLMICMLIIL